MGLQENLQSETVRRLPLREPVTAGPEELLRTVIEKMQDRRLGCTIVVDDDGKPLGLFSESQLLRLLARSETFYDTPVSEVMVQDWPTVEETDPIANMLQEMRSMNVRFVMVVDQHGKLVGLTGQKGLLEYIADHFPEQVMVQRIGGTAHLRSREGA